MEYKGLDRNKWEKVLEETREEFLDKFRDRPTFRSVAATARESYEIGYLRWAMIVLIVLLFVMTSFKAFAVAQPYAFELMNKLAETTHVSAFIITLFSVVAGLFFSFGTTTGIIYFTLLAQSPSIKMKKRQTSVNNRPILGSTKLGAFWRWLWFGHFLSLEWWTPRLPSVLAWVSIAMVGLISWVDNTPLMLIMWVLVTVTEATLAHFVASMIKEYEQYQEAIRAKLEPLVEVWQGEVDSMENHPLFKRSLYLVMRSTLKNIEADSGETDILGRAKKHKPNFEVFDNPAKTKTSNQIIEREMQRWMGNSERFVTLYDSIRGDEETEPVEPDDDLPVDGDGLFVPPHGDEEWTKETLKKHLLRRGKTPGEYGYPETAMLEEYANGHRARTMLRRLKKEGEW